MVVGFISALKECFDTMLSAQTFLYFKTFQSVMQGTGNRSNSECEFIVKP